MRHATSLLILAMATAPALAAPQCTENYGTGATTVTLATGSPGELGLLKALADAFNAQHDTRLCWVKAGSGKSLQLLKDKQVDLVLVHAPDAEKRAVAEGWAINRTLIGSNEFYLVGPSTDPAGIRNAKNAADAYHLIAQSASPFLSRGDNSGTHKKELSIWKMAAEQPKGSWYKETQDFMLATLLQADKQAAYFMTDSSTWVVGQSELKDTQILFRGDTYLVNTYNGLVQPKGATPAQPYAEKLLAFIASDAGQTVFRGFGAERYGEAMYNDAVYAEQYAD
ncbi:substrate-binding domain-containing protein [Ferrimonas marina]|uniref:Tungstate transport system substrate-binding protein n=1 Tax=Ferrimonas marina TaxID=299255 RepID=A0A1M5RZZ7_9GAMM|nr:substrate-binding domain-containing protein [Ferrimonas marina]SHH31618.1 tungstate transport system substrate-binding protein [Ferrimonas marina]